MSAQPIPIGVLAPPFTRETAILKVRTIENNWNSRNPEQVGAVTRRIVIGATGLSFYTGGKRSSRFSHGSGPQSWSIG